MHTYTNKLVRIMIALVLLMSGLALTGSSAKAAAVPISLCAVTGTAAMPGGVVVPVWGFNTNPGSCVGVTPLLPGPVLTVNEGDVVTLSVTNALPAGHFLNIEIPGMALVPNPPVGATVSYTFTASLPGSYLYQSSGDAGRQTAMGLYGALIVNSATAGQAYDTATTAYDVQATLVLSQIDPAFNAAPDTFDLKQYVAKFWLINGLAYPNTAPITAAGGQRLLIRYLNAGYDNTSMVLMGMHQQVLARDARLLNNPFLADAEIIPAGATEDVIATVPSTAPASTNGFALYNRNLHLTNGDLANTARNPGGMLTFITNGVAPLAVAPIANGSPRPLAVHQMFLPGISK